MCGKTYTRFCHSMVDNWKLIDCVETCVRHTQDMHTRKPINSEKETHIASTGWKIAHINFRISKRHSDNVHKCHSMEWGVSSTDCVTHSNEKSMATTITKKKKFFKLENACKQLFDHIKFRRVKLSTVHKYDSISFHFTSFNFGS